MFTEYLTLPHVVVAQRIEAIRPLHVGGDRMLSPDAGILLRLEGGTKVRWIIEPGNPVPLAGDWFVQDNELHMTFVVATGKFDSLFQVA
jgi:hypothetical protein